MTESQLERLLDKLEEIRCGIIDVETKAQEIKVLVQRLTTGEITPCNEPMECPICTRIWDGIRCQCGFTTMA